MARLTLPSVGIALNRTNFAQPVEAAINGTDDTVSSLSTTVTSQGNSIAAKYTKPAQGIPVTDLVTTGLVQTDGTVLRAVKITQAAYDALATKSATTLYLIAG